MITERELREAIEECENTKPSYQTCEKLATFYTLQEHLYPTVSKEQEAESVVGDYGDTEFLSSIRGLDAKRVWLLMDELMSTVQIINPRLYEGVIQKLI